MEPEKYLSMNWVELIARCEALEAALRRVDTALDQTSAVLWKSLKAEVKSVLSSSAETPVSTLCAVCDQIKELHPSTHPWTAKTAPGFCPECLMTGGHKLSCSKAETKGEQDGN